MNPAPAQMPSQPRKSGMPGWLIALIVVLVLIILVVGILALLAFVGVRKYLSASKQIEGRSTVHMIALDANTEYDANGDLCASASSPVPASLTQIRGMKYSSSVTDWSADAATNAGFACLKFTMDSPQYYQYDYKRTPTGFTAFARGDLDGDGVTSEFSMSGKLTGKSLFIDPDVKQTNPNE